MSGETGEGRSDLLDERHRVPDLTDPQRHTQAGFGLIGCPASRFTSALATSISAGIPALDLGRIGATMIGWPIIAGEVVN
jgi:hypothetical protein